MAALEAVFDQILVGDSGEAEGGLGRYSRGFSADAIAKSFCPPVASSAGVGH
jgi:hypothetical protein